MVRSTSHYTPANTPTPGSPHQTLRRGSRCLLWRQCQVTVAQSGLKTGGSEWARRCNLNSTYPNRVCRKRQRLSSYLLIENSSESLQRLTPNLVGRGSPMKANGQSGAYRIQYAAALIGAIPLGNAGIAPLALGTQEALGDCGYGSHKSSRNLFGFQSAQCMQRQRHLCLRSQRRVTADINRRSRSLGIPPVLYSCASAVRGSPEDISASSFTE